MATDFINEIATETGISEKELNNVWCCAIEKAETSKIKNKTAYANAALEYMRKNSGKGLDSSRYIDKNDNLIAPNSVITGADVANYYGFEIPNSQNLGLDPKKLYRVYRPIEEITDNDFNGKFLLSQHVSDLDSSTLDKHRDIIIGTVYDCAQDGIQIKGTVSFMDVKAIDDLDSGKKYLSAGYWYDPVLERGQFNGKPYDIKMTNIKANHIAHVDMPRYKGAVVGDEDTVINNFIERGREMKKKIPNLVQFFKNRLGLDEDAAAKVLSGMDELADEDVKKAEDAAEEANKKAEDDADKKPDDKPVGDDEPEDDEKPKKAEDENKPEAAKGMDSSAISALVAREVAKGIGSFKAEFSKQMVQQNKAMDSAISAYSKLYGEPNRMAFDSAESVYDAILINSGMEHKGKSMEYKQGITDTLVAQSQPKKTHIALDGDSLNGVSADLANLLKGE